jgi:hypothetical protein
MSVDVAAATIISSRSRDVTPSESKLRAIQSQQSVTPVNSISSFRLSVLSPPTQSLPSHRYMLSCLRPVTARNIQYQTKRFIMAKSNLKLPTTEPHPWPQPEAWPAAKVRKTFMEYFQNAQGLEHTFWPSSSVIPFEDPTLLFANAVSSLVGGGAPLPLSWQEG